MLSNSNTDFIRQLYTGCFITEVSARRAINCNGNGRGLLRSSLSGIIVEHEKNKIDISNAEL